MSNSLNIPSRGALDLVSLGALVHRLDPGVIPFRKATACQIHVSGGEFNVAANLADCFGMNNEEDLQKGLGIPGPEVGAGSKLDPSAFFGMMGNVVKKHPQIKAVATTLREVHSTNRHSWGAVAWVNGSTYISPTCELDIFDRVGGGDGFASGFIYGLLAGENPEDAVKLGWAHGALLTTFPGDTTMATVDQVRAFATGSSARIQR